MNSWTSPVDIRPDHLAIVQDILRAHLPAGFKVWVFGSRANWTTKDSSDLDLAVEGAAKLDHKSMSRLEVAFEESDLPYTVDVVDLKAVSSDFRQIVEDQRVLLPAAGSGANVRGEWREGSLGGVIEFKRGYDLPKRDRIPGSVPLVSSSGITDFHAEAKVKGPGVVTGRYGTLGQVFFIPEDFWPLNTALYVRDFKGNDPRFISYFLRRLDFFAYSDKAAVPGLNRNHLHEATVRYPTDIGQQRDIAHVLGTLDDKIELNRRMNQTLEEMARTLFQDWFVDFGPTRAKMEGQDPYLPPELWGLFPDKLVDSELGEIPEGWEIKPLGEIIELAYGKALKAGDRKGGTVPVYGSNGQVGWHDVKLVSGPGIIVGRKGNPGIVTWSHEDFFPIDTAFYVVPESPDPALHFLHYALIDQDLPSMAADSAVPGLNRNLAYMNDQLVPKRSLMEIYDSYVEKLFIRMHLLEKESHDLTLLRDTLLPRLLSGEIKIEEG